MAAKTSPMIRDSDLSRKLAERCEEFACLVMQAKPSSRNRNEIRFFDKGGLVIYVAGPKAGKYVNFGASTHGDMLDLHQEIVGGGKERAREAAKTFLGLADGQAVEFAPVDQNKLERERLEDEAKRKRTAAWLWSKTNPAAGTPAEAYLRGRGIAVDFTEFPCIRQRAFDAEDLKKMRIDPAAFPDGLQSVVFQATNLQGETLAVQQVIIAPKIETDADRAAFAANPASVAWTKAPAQTLVGGVQKPGVETPKRTNGLMEGAAVKLGMPTDIVAFAEGPETGLSVHLATGIPTWIVLGTSNYTRVELPDSVLTVIIAVDMEPSGRGLAAALRAAAFWQKRGREVRLAIPDVDGLRLGDGDYNDLLQIGGEDAVKRCFDQAAVPEAADAGGRAFVCVSPADALALWRATGAPVVATVTSIRPDTHFPDDAKEIVVVLGLGEEMPAMAKRWTDAGAPKISTLRLQDGTLAQAHERKNGARVRALASFATPLGLDALQGLETLVDAPADAVVAICNDAKAAEAARSTLPGAAAVACGADPANIDWRPLAKRRVVIAPTHSPAGFAQAAAQAARAQAAGAAEIRLIEWPLYAPSPAGPVIRHRRLPDGYDMSAARADGWTLAEGQALLDLATPLG